MKMETIFKPCSIKDISNYEKQLNLVFSDEFKNFLLKYNGGYPYPDTFIINEEQGNDCVDLFFGIQDGDRFDLLNVYQKWKNRIIHGFIPIAEDPGGNLILLNCAGNDEGIYFWDHEFESLEDTPPNMRNMSLISTSFEAFFNGLH